MQWTEVYWQATDNKISATDEVWLKGDLVSTQRAKTAAMVQLSISNDSEEQLQVLREKYSKSQGPSGRVRPLQLSRHDKGKSQATVLSGRIS